MVSSQFQLRRALAMEDALSDLMEENLMGSRLQNDGDSMQLQSSDHPSMILVNTPLNGRNYLSWSRSINIVLGAKLKLGFINGKCIKPCVDALVYDKWIPVDCMVTS